MQKPNDHISDFEQRLRGYKKREPSFTRRSGPAYSHVISDFVKDIKPAAPLAPKPEPQPQPIADTPKIVEKPPEVKPTPESQRPVFEKAVAQTKAKRLHRPSLKSLAAVASLVIIFVLSVSLSGRSLKTANKVEANAKTLASTASPSSDIKLIDAADSKSPAQLKISKLGLNQKISTFGNTGQSIGAPADGQSIGWLSTSAKSIDAEGAVVLIGYDIAKDGKGPFFDLKKLQIGDTIELVQGDSQTYNYEVVATRVYASNAIDSAKVMAPYEPGAGLNLVTFSAEGSEPTSLAVFAMRR